MESLIRDQLTTFLKKGSLLTKVQHGFSKGKSCLTNLHETWKDWTRALDGGWCNIFGSQEGLQHGFSFEVDDKAATIGGRIWHWIQVLCTSHFLIELSVKWSTPRITVGSALFLIIVNDIPHCIGANVQIFADDKNDGQEFRLLRTAEFVRKTGRPESPHRVAAGIQPWTSERSCILDMTLIQATICL